MNLRTSATALPNPDHSRAIELRAGGEEVGLRLKLSRKVRLKRYPVIARVAFEQIREDLKALLEFAQHDVHAVPPRLKAYLAREGLWDAETTELTETGCGVLLTGIFPALERGLYHIWYTDNDALLGTRPILMQRDTAFFPPQTRGWLNGAEAMHSVFAVSQRLSVNVLDQAYNGQKSRTVKHEYCLPRLEPEVVCAADKDAQLDLSWDLGSHDSGIRLKGQLDVLEFNGPRLSSKPVPFELVIDSFVEKESHILSKVASQLDGSWDSVEQRLAISLEHIQEDEKAIQRFVLAMRRCTDLETDYGLFSSVLAENIPIKPVDHSDAEQWHKQWLADFYSKTYHSSEKARRHQVEWLDHTALISFELALKDGNSLLGSLTREATPQAYWQVAAIADLSPAKSKKLRLPLSLTNGDALNLRQLLAQLGGAEDIRQIIYSDRYVHTRRHKDNLAAVASCFRNADGLLLTLCESQAELPGNWERRFFEKQHDNHGRYWILVGTSHTYCWECSTGLDFLRERDGAYTVEGTPGFSPREESELPSFLQGLLREIKGLEVAQ